MKTYGYDCIDRVAKPEIRGAHYGFVHTGAVLESLESKGWEIQKIQVSKAKDPTTARHLIRGRMCGLRLRRRMRLDWRYLDPRSLLARSTLRLKGVELDVCVYMIQGIFILVRTGTLGLEL